MRYSSWALPGKFLFPESGLLLVILLLGGLTACRPRPTNPAPTLALSPIPPTIGVQETGTTPTPTEPEETPAKITAQTAAPDKSQITAKIDVDNAPGNMAVGDGFLWVIARDSIVKIDPQTNQVVGKPIPTGVPANADTEAIAVGDGVLWITIVGWGDLSSSSDIDSIVRIDSQTDATEATIQASRGPMSLALTPGAVWVVNFGNANTVSRIDSTTNQITGDPIKTGSAPLSMAVGDGSVWVANHDAGTVTRIDPTTNQVIADISLPSEPHRVAYGEGAVWVGNWHDKSLSRIDPQTNQVVGKPIPIGFHAGNIAAGYGNVWVTSDYRGVGSDPEDVVLARINPQTNQLVETIPLGGQPVDVEITEEAAWVSIQNPDRVLRIEPSQPIGAAQPALLPKLATAASLPTSISPVLKDSASMHIGRVIPLGNDFPFGLAFARQSLWVLMRRASFQPPGSILRIDPGSGEIIGEPIHVGFDPWSFAVTEDAIWVAKNGPSTVLRIDPITQQIVASLDIYAMLVAGEENGAWISSGEFSDSTVHFIDPLTNHVIGDPIPAGVEPIQIVAGAGAVWVGAHGGPPSITRIDPKTGEVAATIEVGFPVHGLAAGPDSIWAADYHDHKVVHISPQTNQIVGDPILLPFPPYAMAASATDAWAGVAAIGEEAGPGDDRVVRIDLRTNTIVDTIHVGGPTIAMVFASGSLWIATERPNLIVQVVPDP